MTTYLCATPIEGGVRHVSFEQTPTPTLKRGGLTSPVFGAFGADLRPLGGDEAVILCFPRSPRALLAGISAEARSEVVEATFISHGLASVGIYGARAHIEQSLADFRYEIGGYELWPLEDHLLKLAEVVNEEPGLAFDPDALYHDVPLDNLPLDAAQHVLEFNATIAVARHRAARYAPELQFALDSKARSVETIAQRLRELRAHRDDPYAVRLYYYFMSALLEVNASLALVLSQTLGRPQPKLLFSDYPVGNLSLLGVGGFMRGLWAFYAHLDGKFAAVDHHGRAQGALPASAPFDPFVDRQRVDYQVWSDSTAILKRLPNVATEPRRRVHLVHLSSRFGFHETVSSIGASWQSLHFAASQEWSVLTLTHEFLHSHVRLLTGVLFPADTDYDALARLVSGAEATRNGGDSLRVALATAALRLRRVRATVGRVRAEDGYLGVEGFNGRPNGDELRNALADGLRHVQEIIVHVLDYLYCFGADDGAYLGSIWHSWSTVPSVAIRLNEYLLRSLSAIAALSGPEQINPGPVFDDAADRLARHLEAACAASEESILRSALAYLVSKDGRARLEAEFGHAYYVVQLARTFLYDDELAFDLLRDEATVVLDDGSTAYTFAVGEYPDGPVQSPLRFLGSLLRGNPVAPAPETEFATLWQMLALAESDRRW